MNVWRKEWMSGKMMLFISGRLFNQAGLVAVRSHELYKKCPKTQSFYRYTRAHKQSHAHRHRRGCLRLLNSKMNALHCTSLHLTLLLIICQVIQSHLFSFFSLSNLILIFFSFHPHLLFSLNFSLFFFLLFFTFFFFY